MVRKIISAIILITMVVSCKAIDKNKDEDNKSASTSYAKLSHCRWLLGCWENISEDGVTTELWKKVNDSTYHAESFIVAEEDTVFYEIISLEQRMQNINYIVRIKDQKSEQSVSFSLTNSTDSSLAFENPQHNFPTKICYFKMGSDSLFAEISGIEDGAEKKEGFPFSRVKE